MRSSTQYHWTVLKAGPLWLDGGSMFGVVPRVLWSKFTPPDDRGRIEVGHNCILLTRVGDPSIKLVIETGSGDKFDARSRDIFGLDDYSIRDALLKSGTDPAEIREVIVSHLHFDHAGGLTRRVRDGESPDWIAPPTGKSLASVKFTFPNAPIHVQRREWDDALANNSVMTRTYLRDHLDPIRDRVRLIDSPPPFAPGSVPARDAAPAAPLVDRLTEILPGIFTFIVPGHTWGQHAIVFTDAAGRIVVFTPDVLPTLNHVGAAYNMAYDVEPFISTISRRWFLEEAVKNDWLLVLDHEPGNPICRALRDGKGWFVLTSETENPAP